MGASNFFLAAAAVIPIIAFVQAAQRTVTLRLQSREAEATARRMYVTGRLVNALWSLGEMVLFVWAEFVCLRRLEIGRAPFGGAAVVWLALAYGASNVALLRLGSYIDDDDVVALFAWMERRGWMRPPRGHRDRNGRATESAQRSADDTPESRKR